MSATTSQNKAIGIVKGIIFFPIMVAKGIVNLFIDFASGTSLLVSPVIERDGRYYIFVQSYNHELFYFTGSFQQCSDWKRTNSDDRQELLLATEEMKREFSKEILDFYQWCINTRTMQNEFIMSMNS